MNRPPRVLFVTPELSPWAKVGGLGEVAHDLPQALARAGLDVRLVVPAYPALIAAMPDAREIARFEAPGGALAPARLLESSGPVRTYLVDCKPYFARAGGPYGGPDGIDWPDNPLRFGLLCRIAALLGATPGPVDWRPDVVHCNDWPSGLVPAYLAHSATGRAATVMTVHNLAYQGLFAPGVLGQLALAPESFSPEGLEFHGSVSFLKAGLYYATLLSTVSPGYAREIQRPELGFGLDGLLRARTDRLRGIANGIDTAIWDPARDPLIATRYDAGNLEGKRENKAALQRELGLRPDPDAFLLGMIGRMVEQKGVDLILGIVAEAVQLGMQFAVLGQGASELEDAWRALGKRHPGSTAVRIESSEPLAHRIEAGADAFLMPSRFEPCGLNQLYSMRYGTPPIVRRTGGLADSVVDACEENLHAGRATGFVFDEATPQALLAAVQRAQSLFRDAPRWAMLQRCAMSRDSGWAAAAQRYVELYRDALSLGAAPQGA